MRPRGKAKYFLPGKTQNLIHTHRIVYLLLKMHSCATKVCSLDTADVLALNYCTHEVRVVLERKRTWAVFVGRRQGRDLSEPYVFPFLCTRAWAPTYLVIILTAALEFQVWALRGRTTSPTKTEEWKEGREEEKKRIRKIRNKSTRSRLFSRRTQQPESLKKKKKLKKATEFFLAAKNGGGKKCASHRGKVIVLHSVFAPLLMARAGAAREKPVFPARIGPKTGLQLSNTISHVYAAFKICR